MEAPLERDTEIEWQLDAHDLRPVLRWVEEAVANNGSNPVTIGRGPTLNQVDTYLDTADRRIDRAGYTVRLRKTPRRPSEATLKSLASERPGGGALRIRMELGEQLDVEEPAEVAHGKGPVGQRVRALVGSQQLVPLFEVQTRRRVFPLSTDGKPSGELLLDETTFREPGGRILGRLRRVEVEAPQEAVDLVGPLVDSLQIGCGLQPAVLSKYETALVASGLRRAPSESFGLIAVEAGDTIGQVGLATLRRQFAILLAKEPGTRLGDDIEALHDMRVASRRLRAALSLLADYLPAEAVRLKPELAWLGQTIGAVRDLDVQLVRLGEWTAAVPPEDREPLSRLRALLDEERARARAEMLKALDSARYERFVRRFSSMLRTRTGARTPAGLAAAPDLVERRHRALRKAMKRIDGEAEPAAYHRLRIASKRFRYALEFLSELYDGDTKPMVRRTVELQDLLGDFQDADVAIGRFRRLAAAQGVELGPQTVFVMGEIAERYRSSMEGIRNEVPAAYAGLTGKVWKRLLKRLEDARPPVTPARPPA